MVSREAVALDMYFGRRELQIGRNLKIGMTPGPDGISNEVLKEVTSEWLELLLETYNACLREVINDMKINTAYNSRVFIQLIYYLIFYVIYACVSLNIE